MHIFRTINHTTIFIRVLIISLFLAIFFTGCETLQKQTSQTDETNQSQTNSSNGDAEKTDSADAEKTENEAQGICVNPYYPISEKPREYKISGSSPGSYVLTQTPNEGDSFKEIRKFASDLTLNINWKCTDEGLRNADFNNTGTMPVGNFKMDTLESSGITLPKVWEMGKKWSADYKVSAKINVRGISGSGDGTVKVNNEIVSMNESISVPGGDFETAKVDSEILIDISVKGRKVPTSKLKMSLWLSPKVGLVKQEAKSQFGNQTVEYLGEK